MPRIVAHTLSYPPWRRIGAELATHALLEHLADSGWTCVVAPSAAQPQVTRRVGRAWAVPLRLARASRPDVVLTHAGYVTPGMEHAQRYGAPLVVSGHGGPPGWMAAQARRAEPALLLANSEGMARSLERTGLPVQVLRPPVWPARRWPITPAGREVGLINANPDKGGKMLAWLAGRNPPTRFVVLAGGYGQQVPFGHLPNVTVLPHGTPPSRFWRRVRVLLMPSVEESWGMAAVEAMHRGIPIIGSTARGLMECLGGMQQTLPVDDRLLWDERLGDTLGPRWQDWHIMALRRSAELHPAPDLMAAQHAIGGLIGMDDTSRTKIEYRNSRTGQTVAVEEGSMMHRRLDGLPLVWQPVTAAMGVRQPSGTHEASPLSAEGVPEGSEPPGIDPGREYGERVPPPRHAPTSTWIEWAVTCGAERAAATDAGRSALIALYGDGR